MKRYLKACEPSCLFRNGCDMKLVIRAISGCNTKVVTNPPARTAPAFRIGVVLHICPFRSDQAWV